MTAADVPIDWAAARAATIEVRQWLRYEYPGPIYDLHQMLMLIPPDELSGQRLLFFDVDVDPPASPRYHIDSHGNRICQIAIPFVQNALEFQITFRVERRPNLGAPPVGPDEARIFVLPSPLTEASPELRAVAREIAAGDGGPVALADAVNTWVHRRLVYSQAVTDIQTRAGDAVALGAGVCQDYAHVMLALCRQLGLPARYVSGHLLGEGAMHAWTQVLLPAGEGGDNHGIWQAYDPTNGCRAGLPYVTVAAGKDYGGVSPTRGSFRAPYAGSLVNSHKRARVLSVT